MHRAGSTSLSTSLTLSTSSRITSSNGNEPSHYFINNIHILNISYQELVYITHNHYITAVQDHLIITDIKEAQSSYSITQSIGLNYTSIYDTFGTIMLDGIDLSSIAEDYRLIKLIDFMKQSSVNPQSTSSRRRTTASAQTYPASTSST